MSDFQRPDDPFEAALARSLQRHGEAVDGCPDPEILAAYWDRSLASDERTHWDAHFAACARCQAQLAALARTEGVEATTVHTAPWSFGWPLDLRWLAPAASLAVVVFAVWVIRPDSVPDQQSLPDPAPRSEAADLAAENRPTTESPEASAQIETSQERLQPEIPPSNRDSVARRERTETELDDTTFEALEQRELRASPSQLAAAPTTRVDPLRPVDAPLEEQPTRRALTGVSRAARVTDTQQVDADVASALVVTSPDPSVRWRVAPTGAIERSTDGGSTWTEQRAAGDGGWSAGSAPSPSTCWIVGTSGAVVLTTDGERWQRTAVPTEEDLVAVEASNSLTATVTTVSGRRYDTADGGNTWAERL